MYIFHLAIPVANLKETKTFYTQIFNATIGREYNHYVIFNFFGHQLVCHVDAKSTPQEVTMYPRHFGIIFENKKHFDQVYQNCKDHRISFFEDLFERYKNEKGWHYSFFVSDPSNNLIELKHYINKQDIFGE